MYTSNVYVCSTCDGDISVEILGHFQDPCLHLFLDESVLFVWYVEGFLHDVKPVGMVHEHTMHLVAEGQMTIMH